MLDRRLRPRKDQILGTVAASPAERVHPHVLTVLALGTTLGAAALAAASRPMPALAAWLTGRLLDGLDGPVARHRGESSDLGGYLDIVGDTIGYAAVPIGVALGVDDRSTWIAVAVLLGTFFVNAISWTYLSAVLEKHGAGAGATGETTTVTMAPALVEGTETIIGFSAFIAFPSLASWLFAVMAALVSVNVGQRIGWARRHLDGPGPALTCEQVAEMLQTFLDGELDVDGAHRIERHLDDCRRCGLEAETYEALRRAIRRRGQFDPALLARLQHFGMRLAAGDPKITARLDHLDGPDGRHR